MGNSNTDPERKTESRFVADVGEGLDTRHSIVASGQVVTVAIETTRCVGTVDDAGFLVFGQNHVAQGTLAETLLLTIAANIAVRDTGGTLGRDGLDVEVFLHKGTDDVRFLGKLAGGYGLGWQRFVLDVNVLDVKFPADPCPTQIAGESCGRAIEPRRNEISFVFTGDINRGTGMSFEVDWLTLEPKDEPGLAWRPVLLAHGWSSSSAAWEPGTAWRDGLELWDVGCHAVDLTSMGKVRGNAAQIKAAVADLKRRFGVQRVQVVAHSKGGVDTREHVERNSDVETLLMIATPNAGSFMAGAGIVAATVVAGPPAGALAYLKMGELTIGAMLMYNEVYVRNPNITFVTAASAYLSAIAHGWEKDHGPNDEVVSVQSVGALGYSLDTCYPTSPFDPESLGVCAARGVVTNHSCLLYYARIFNDLFPAHLTHLTAPLPTPTPPAALPTPLRAAADAGVDELATGVQGVMSGAALTPPAGATHAYTALVDAVDSAMFLVLADVDPVSVELVGPTGTRIDATTPLTDPSVAYAPFLNAGPLAYTGYRIEGPETGSWTIEVAGTGVPSQDSAYGVVALVQTPPGGGVVLAARVDPELCALGDAVTITAAATADGAPVTGASVTALVEAPDGATTAFDLVEDATTAGDYTGALPAATQVGLHAIVVSAEGTTPAFTRQQLVQVSVAPSRTTFSGTVADGGVDTDGDGRYDQLVVDVGLDVDLAAVYGLFGTLIDGAGTAIEQVHVEQALAPGPQTVSLAFDGAALFDLGHDGPYLVDDLVVEDVATATGLARSPAYTTAAYAHTDFQRPALLVTGNTADRGEHDINMERLPYETLVIEVEVDSSVAADVEATANLYAAGGIFVEPGRTGMSLTPGLNLLAFRFSAFGIFRAGQPGPYTLQLLSVSGTSADGAPVSLRLTGTVAVTRPYRLEDFAASPRFSVGGTLTGLLGTGQLELELSVEGPPGTPATVRMRPRNGAFLFTFPTLAGGNPYSVRVTQQPTNPAQVCTVVNSSGTIDDANVTDVAVTCT